MSRTRVDEMQQAPAASPAPPNYDLRRMSSSFIKEPAHPALEDLDPATSFLYKPHTIWALLLGVVALVYFSGAFAPQQPATPEAAYTNAKAGIAAVCGVFLVYSLLQGPRTALVRPHPALWRVTHGLLTLYLLFLVYLLFQTADDARGLLRHLYPELGVPLNERAYGGDCRLWLPQERAINWPVIKATLFDEFVVAHSVGWWGKALIMRNYPMLWVLSIGFELMELTFQHMLPNFNECWWDSWILDVAVCNFLGMVTGMATVRYFQAKEYDWRGLSKQRSLFGKVRRSILQFTPHSFESFDWRVTASPMRLLQCLLPVVVFLVFEVNAFFLKYILWVPPMNPLNSIRLLILGLGAVPAVKDWYEFIDAGSDPYNKLGPSAWVAAALCLAETLVCVKHGRGMFPNPWPRAVVIGWSAFGVACVGGIGAWMISFYVLNRRASSDGGERLKSS